MNIIYLKHHNIDKEKWDNCIKNAPNGNIYVYSWYLDLVAGNWDALITPDYNYVFPLTWRQKFGVKYLYQPCFSQQTGLFSKEFFKQEVLRDFLNSIPEDFKLIEINLNKYCKEPVNNFLFKDNVTYELDLIYPYNDTKKNYSENTIRNIKKSEKNTVYLSKHIQADEMIKLFRDNRGKDVPTLGFKDYTILNNIIDESLKRECGELWGAFDAKDEMCAAAFFVEANGKYVFLFSAVNALGRSNGAMFSIIDNFVRTKSESPYVLDFEGSNNENLARFYAAFGAKKNNYYSIRYNNLPYFVKLFYNFKKKHINK